MAFGERFGGLWFVADSDVKLVGVAYLFGVCARIYREYVFFGRLWIVVVFYQMET